MMGERVISWARWRGHQIVTRDWALWVYEDTGTPVSQDPARACGACGLPPTPEGHDGCLGTVPGVSNACCGHGEKDLAYVQFGVGGPCVRGEGAIELIRCLKEGG